MDEAEIRRAAEQIATARLAGHAIDALPEALRPADGDSAYAIQAALTRRLAAPLGLPVGYKIGCTTEVMQRYLGIDQPCAGRIHLAGFHWDRASLRLTAYRRLGLECEVAVLLGEDLPGGGRGGAAGVARAVAAAMAAIEVVDDRYADYRALGAPTLIADDFFNAGAVVAAPDPATRALELGAVEGRLLRDGSEIGRGRGRDIMGHPLAALAWLADRRAALGEPLRAGEVVLLGSIVRTEWPTVAGSFTADLGPLGRATATVVAGRDAELTNC